MNSLEFLSIPEFLLGNVSVAWTFLLLMTRYSACMIIVPGLGAGVQGLTVRMPAVLVFAYVSLQVSPLAIMPVNFVDLIVQVIAEILTGYFIGMVPQLVVASAQLAGQLASTSMGFGAAQLIDPSSGAQLSELSKILSDIIIVLFFAVSGHHLIIYTLSGLSGTIPPGELIIQARSIEVLINRSQVIFETGLLVATPVIVALLLTQFLMGLITKAVPQVNIFIVSFPLTIGIGLILTIITLPGLISFVKKDMTGIENVLYYGLIEPNKNTGTYSP
jgi:flagellar biosynthesis protein FliR